MSPARIALVVHDLSNSGGVSTVARFLHNVIGQSDRFEDDLFSLAHGSDDRASVRLRDPRTWTRGVQVQTETNDGVSYDHVGAVGAEIEYCRYQPRSVLTERLRGYDLVQIVAGTPAWAHVARPLDLPVALQVATLAREERYWVLNGRWRPKALWRQAMVRLTDRLDHTALRHIDAAFVENQWMHDHLAAHMPPDDVIFAPPGVDTEEFVPGPRPSEGEHVLSVGRFEDPRKNVMLLFEAYATLRNQLESVPPLVLAGRSAPPDAAWVRAEALGIRDAVTFQEDVSMDELAHLYRTAALYVVSSDEEGLGLTILEAMASGRPVVSTACGGPSTTVLDGGTGRLVPAGDAAALAGAMADVIGDPERADAMGHRGRRRVEKHFSMEATGQQFLDTYKTLLDDSGS
ncbi:glycosyltransferase family 4 protein [Salinibacter ruber]|uniref:glycosyltransferase family 4 protein n=1 Tax=Salinibacter ruber TaxID=146919 RepID=UPI00160865B0|nr:glycosyltransferase family 4 protein [Salinibacter ruber]MBB4062408.1 glycosyltransferase involved in cell wall biosynthesis [Salinibacter ruber]